MARLIIIQGTSPGAGYETLHNVTTNRVDGGAARRIEEVTIIYTSGVAVEADIARLLVLAGQFLLPCRPASTIRMVSMSMLGFEDVDSRARYEELRRRLGEIIGDGDVVDATGGRKAMSIAAVVTAIDKARSLGIDVSVVATSVPPESYQAARASLDALKRNYDVKSLIEWFLGAAHERGLGEAAAELEKRYPSVVELLRGLVTCRGRTVQLYP